MHNNNLDQLLKDRNENNTERYLSKYNIYNTMKQYYGKYVGKLISVITMKNHAEQLLPANHYSMNIIKSEYMKNIFIGIISIIFIVSIYGCSHNPDPQFRIRNEQSSKVDMKIQATGGNKFSINDIEPGQTTEYRSVSEGNITTTAVIQNESISFLAAKNTHYTIVISNGKPPTLQVDQ